MRSAKIVSKISPLGNLDGLTRRWTAEDNNDNQHNSDADVCTDGEGQDDEQRRTITKTIIIVAQMSVPMVTDKTMYDGGQ